MRGAGANFLGLRNKKKKKKRNTNFFENVIPAPLVEGLRTRVRLLWPLLLPSSHLEKLGKLS